MEKIFDVTYPTIRHLDCAGELEKLTRTISRCPGFINDTLKNGAIEAARKVWEERHPLLVQWLTRLPPHQFDAYRYLNVPINGNHNEWYKIQQHQTASMTQGMQEQIRSGLATKQGLDAKYLSEPVYTLSHPHQYIDGLISLGQQLLVRVAHFGTTLSQCFSVCPTTYEIDEIVTIKAPNPKTKELFAGSSNWIVLSNDNELFALKAHNLNKHRRLTLPLMCSSLVFDSTDPHQLWIGGTKGEIINVDLRTSPPSGIPVLTRVRSHPISTLIATPTHLIIGLPSEIFIYDKQSKELKKALDITNLAGAISQIAVNKNKLAIVRADTIVETLNIETGELLRLLHFHSPVKSLCWFKNRLVVGYEHHAEVFEENNPAPIGRTTIIGHLKHIVSCDGRLLALVRTRTVDQIVPLQLPIEKMSLASILT